MPKKMPMKGMPPKSGKMPMHEMPNGHMMPGMPMKGAKMPMKKGKK